MNKLKILVVEGNTKEENVNFNQAGCASQSENFGEHIKMHEPENNLNYEKKIMTRFMSELVRYHFPDVKSFKVAKDLFS